MQEDIKSYKSIYQLRQAFTRSGGHSDTFADKFNKFETPANLYFRIFFHFNTGHGLLNTGEQFIDNRSKISDYDNSSRGNSTNTALNYLVINGEHQRRQLLDDFVKLLSNINMYSPWYFQNIEGLQEALQRSEYTGEFKIDEEPKYITIKCLEDAYDNRISTLLDLYKSVAFSKVQHKEILPANLRRFDMTLYIINTPLAYVHYGYGDIDLEKTRNGLNGHQPVSLADYSYQNASFEIPNYREWAQGSDKIFSSAKIIEFQGCEIDANSAASAYGEVKSDEPFQMKHDIKITYKNIIEQRFNDSLNRIIGDYIFMDMDRVDRESEDNIWNTVNTPYSEEDIMNTLDASRTATYTQITEDVYDEENDMIIPGESKIEISDPNPNSIQSMLEANALAENQNRGRYMPEGQIVVADDALTPYDNAKAYEALLKYRNNPPNVSDSLLTKRNNYMSSKMNPMNIATDFMKGAVSTAVDYATGYVKKAENYAKTIATRLTFGNLYWGSVTTAMNQYSAKSLGKTLTKKGLNKALGNFNKKYDQSFKDVEKTVSGWLHKTESGSKLSRSLFGHR